MQNKGKLTIMKYFRACVGSFLVFSIFHNMILILMRQEVKHIDNSVVAVVKLEMLRARSPSSKLANEPVTFCTNIHVLCN